MISKSEYVIQCFRVRWGEIVHEIQAFIVGQFAVLELFFKERKFEKTMKTSDEIFDKKQRLVHEILRTRREMGMTQKNIEAACGVKQPVIARMERGLTDPQLTTILKVLRPLGKTLKIVDIEEDEKE
ncbi:MAG: helix-turn-helix domain-containing protein [Peptococcaceae bacterium]|nr:helix-turn-helix domain-containing protein [Peptococcaceae bacterium]